MLEKDQYVHTQLRADIYCYLQDMCRSVYMRFVDAKMATVTLRLQQLTHIPVI